MQVDTTPLLFENARKISKAFLVVFVLLVCAVIASVTIAAVALHTSHTATKTPIAPTPEPPVSCPDNMYGKNGVVASFHPLATDAGITILEQGGNAYDAAAAVQFALTVVEPHMSGIGGGCFILFYSSASRTVRAIDGREEAPETCRPNYFCKDQNDPNCTAGAWPYPDKNTGGLPVGVPGTVDAINRMLTEYGNLTLSQVLQPAIQIAENGFAIDQNLYTNIVENRARLALFNDSAKLYLQPDGSPKNIGDIIKNPDLANTFRDLAQNGRDLFYTGQVAQDIVNTVRDAVNPVTGRAGELSMSDFAQYKAVYRAPTNLTYRGQYNVYGFPSPGSGGMTMGLMLNMIEAIDFTTMVPYSVDHVARLADIQNIAFADRNHYIGDADFVDVPTEGFLNKNYARLRRSLLNLFNAQPVPVGPGVPPGAPITKLTKRETPVEHGTTHFITADKWGNIVSITSTIELGFGSAVTVPGRGFLLNNELTDFDEIGDLGNGVYVANGPEGGKKPRRTALGADATTLGGKRPRSSMTPTILTDVNGKPILSVGAPGGSLIIGHVFNALHKLVDYDMCLDDAMAPPYVISRNGAMTLPTNATWWKNYNNIVASVLARGFSNPVSGTQASHTLAIRVKDDGSYIGGSNDYFRSASVRVL